MGDELVTPSWPTVEQDTELDEEEDEVDDGVGPDWDGYISVTSWLLQDGVPEQDLFGDENKMLEGNVDIIAKPPASDSTFRNEWMAAVEEVMIL